jgi:nitrate/nitrite transporter NarK
MMLAAGYFADRSQQKSRYVWPFLLVAGAAFLGSYLATGTSFWISFVFLIIAGGAMYAPYGPFFAIIPEILPSNVAGEVTALVNSLGALGSFLGSYFVGFLQGYTGNSKAGYLFMSASLTLAGACMWWLRPMGEAAGMRVRVDAATARE